MQALIDGKVLCVHGGLSPDLRTLDQARPISLPHMRMFIAVLGKLLLTEAVLLEAGGCFFKKADKCDFWYCCIGHVSIMICPCSLDMSSARVYHSALPG